MRSHTYIVKRFIGPFHVDSRARSGAAASSVSGLHRAQLFLMTIEKKHINIFGILIDIISNASRCLPDPVDLSSISARQAVFPPLFDGLHA